jgi:hypothetical protein
MYFKVKITKGLSQAKSGGFTGNNLNKQVISFGGADMNASSKHLENTRYLKEVSRDEANLEAEKGESAFGDINGDGFPEHMLIGGKRHSNGGTPLNLPDGTFIFSDTASMRIKDPKILAKFGKKTGSFTPAELAKPYDLNKYRKILEDPNSDKVDKKSAELMIKNINMKLGALAIAQESKKGFPQGVPEVARPYMEAMGIKEEDLVPQKAQPEAQVNNQAMNNPYENQGMGAQSPEEESREQGPGMQNPQEESMESPMGKYGFQMGRRLRVAQEGMEQGQPSPEEMAMMQQQEGAPQQQGENPLTQMVQQVQQMLQQGAQPADVVMQLLQKQVPPEAIMQILVQVGMPQEEAQATIQQVMEQGQQQNPQEEMAEGPQGQNPQEEMMEAPMAQYGMSMGGYGMPFHDTQYRKGGSLNRFQEGGVKNKTYTKENLPKDAVVRERYSTDTLPGDFVKQKDGSYIKVTARTLSGNPTADTKSLKYSPEEFRKASPENAALLDEANAIIKKGIDNKTIINKNGNVEITGKWNGDLKDRNIISKAFNATNKEGFLGTDKYKVVKQGSTGPYSKTVNGKIKNSGSFVAGFTPELYEEKFIFEQSKGLGMSDDEAYAEVDRIKKDPKTHAVVRRDFLGSLGVKDVPKEDKDLLSSDYYKKNYDKVTLGIEGTNTLDSENYRPSMGNEGLAGFEHYDALGYSPDFQHEQDAAEAEATAAENADVTDEETPEDYPEIPEAQPWAQDRLNRLNAGLDYFSNKKYLPWAANYHPEMLSPTFYDPTRELAAQSEQANITNQALGQFMGAQDLSSRAASIQGQGAKQAADTLGRYNALNVGVANQFAGNNLQLRNEAQRYNQAQNKQLYDQNVIANQQNDNTKRALRHNLGESENTLLTNMWKTDALNQQTPQYAIDPSTGGRMHFTKGRVVKPTSYKDYLDYAKELESSNIDPIMKKELLKNYMKGSAPSQSALEASLEGYGKKGGTTNMGYVMGSNVFPFMFT